jgi:hypothetical protein
MKLRTHSLLSAGLAVAGLSALALGLACGGGSSSVAPANGATPASTTGNVGLSLSDASTEDWATIGVKVLGIALIPSGGSAASAVTVYTAPTPVPVVNLVQLDQISELLGNVAVPVGTYTKAVLTLSANPGDVTLTAAADPSAGFVGTPAATYAGSQIQIQNTTGATGSKTVQVSLTLASPLVVSATTSNALDLEFNLGNPAFIVDHVPATGATPFWAVNFSPAINHHPAVVTDLVLRHLYATVTQVNSDGSLTVTKDYPLWPAVSPETPVASAQSLAILPDATNGTLFYDLDATPVTPATVTSFSSLATTLATSKYVRIAARYQANGTLVAARVWASSTFNNVYVSPEGHVLHVNTGTNIVTVENEQGVGVPVQVTAATQFFFRTPADALTDATAIGTGTAFLAANNLVRGFKVHTSVDPTTTPMTALTMDIEIAKYDGTISLPTNTGFTFTRTYGTATDDYTKTLPYLAAASANGHDASGDAITGFKWWNFAYPTLVDSGANATTDFGAIAAGSVTFGGTAVVPVMKPWGVSYATWNDSAAANAWSARWAVLEPTELPKGTVTSPWSAGSDSFSLSLPGGASSVPVVVGLGSGSATLVYQVDKTAGVITVSTIDVTTAAGQADLATNLVNTAKVKVYGVPQANGSIKAYVLFYYTGTLPAN